MLTVKSFTFGPFQENTYVLHDSSGECVIIDPGCFTSSEQQELAGYISANKLKVTCLLNTHCHVDHVAGNAFVADKFQVLPEIHKEDLVILESQQQVSKMYGLPCEVSPKPVKYLVEGDMVKVGKEELHVIFAPGHAPGHIVFYNKNGAFVISGDVLFSGSIGRTDLPLGDYATLEQSILTKMYTLPEETVVHCGHGPSTTIGREKYSNPFVNVAV